MAKPCWFGSEGTLLISLSVTLAPFFAVTVLGTQIFEPSYSTLTIVRFTASGVASSARALPTTAPRERSPATTVAPVRMRALLGGRLLPGLYPQPRNVRTD